MVCCQLSKFKAIQFLKGVVGHNTPTPSSSATADRVKSHINTYVDALFVSVCNSFEAGFADASNDEKYFCLRNSII